MREDAKIEIEGETQRTWTRGRSVYMFLISQVNFLLLFFKARQGIHVPVACAGVSEIIFFYLFIFFLCFGGKQRPKITKQKIDIFVISTTKF